MHIWSESRQTSALLTMAFLLQQSVTRAPEIRQAMTELQGPLATLEAQLASSPGADQALKDIAARGDQAMAAGQAALASAELSGPLIIRSVQDVDARIFAAAYKGEPDIAALSGSFTSLQKLPFSGQSTAPKPSGGAVNVAFVDNLNKVVEVTNELQKPDRWPDSRDKGFFQFLPHRSQSRHRPVSAAGAAIEQYYLRQRSYLYVDDCRRTSALSAHKGCEPDRQHDCGWLCDGSFRQS